MWDLQRNGGNVVATTERILSGRGLEVVSLDFILCSDTVSSTSPNQGTWKVLGIWIRSCLDGKMLTNY